MPFQDGGDPTDDYVRRWFIPLDALVRRSGGTPGQIDALLEAGAAPGIVYSRSAKGLWWSALGAFAGKIAAVPDTDGAHWYAPSALYWLRRALVMLRSGMAPDAAAQANAAEFCDQFVAALASEPLARHNYPMAFPEHRLDEAAARDAAQAEWRAWIAGAYAVCLRSFTGQSCVAKESLARHIRTQMNGEASRDPDLELLDSVERLSVWLMPFAPFERPVGTPGIAIDKVFALLALGNDEPYAYPDPAPKLADRPMETPANPGPNLASVE